jgi:hypothetical protein
MKSITQGFALAIVLVQGVILALGGSSLASLTPNKVLAASNPIVTENQQPGTTDWQIDYDNLGNPLLAANHEIEGYASSTSVNAGGQISFMVNVSAAAQYTMKIFRMGYYPTGTNADGTTCSGGCGGRLMQTIGPLNGSPQPTCPTTTTTTNFGLIECHWATAYTLTVPTTWTTGNYIVKLIRSDDKMEQYMTFVVRNDAGPADIVLSMDVTTWEAYNMWGGAGNNNIGYDLYGKFNDVTYNNLSSQRSYAVSFDRPYLDQAETDGAGSFLLWDYPMIRWLEKNGYNVTYATDIDLENNPNLMAGRKAFINTGHDEYYSDNMRANLQGYINGGAHMGFFSANNVYFRIRFANDSGGQAYRNIVCYKDAILDPQSPPTLQWRNLTPPQPENAIVGMLQNGTANDRAFRVYDSTSWIYAGTGLVNYVSGTPVTSGSGQNAIAGIVGYEFDERAANASSLSSYTSYEPAGLQQVAHSNVPAGDNGGTAAFSDATVYTATSGAIVFAAGTIQWAWGLDNGYNNGYCSCNPGYANSKSQQITTNILNKFLTTTPTPPAVSLSPTSLTFASQAVNSTSPSQAVTLSNSGSAPLTISSITTTGTNAGDFAQTNNCPMGTTTLAAGASCTINVTFTPTATGTRSGTVSITDNAGGSPHTVALSGTGAAAPNVAFTPTSLTFTSQQVNTTSASQAVTLTNNGSAALTISSVGFTGTNPGDFADTTTCPFSPSTLAAGGSCTINVTFTPTASGTRSASLSVTDNASGSPQTVAVSGTGTTAPVPAVTLSPTSLTFASQALNSTSAAQTVTLTNSGNAALTISSIGLTGTNAADFAQTNTCPISPSTLPAGANCTFNVTFTPTATGTRTASVSITDNATGSPHSVALTGIGAASAGTYLSDGFESGNLRNWTKTGSSGGKSSVQSTVVNSGTNAAALTNNANTDYTGLFANLSGGAQAQTYSRFCFRLSGISGSTPLAQGRDVNNNNLWEVDYDAASKGLDIYFWNGAHTRTNLTTPANLVAANTWYCAEIQANETTSGHGQVWLNGTSEATVNTDLSVTNPYSQMYLWNNGAAGTVYMDDIQVANVYNGPVGAGATPLPAPVVSLSPTSLTYASQTINTTSGTQAITLTNTGNAPLTLSSIGITGTNAGDFVQSNTCPLSPTTIAAGGTCTINVSFTPTASGTRTASVSVTDNASGSPHTVSLSGTGNLPPAPAVSLSPTSLTFASQGVNSTSVAQAITLTNSGNAALTITSVGFSGTNSGDFAQTNTCPISPSTLAAGANCTISVTFTPLGSGSRSANLSITDNASGSPHTAALSGTGTLPAGTYLTDGFENGLGIWTIAGSGSATVQTTTVNSGTKAAALTNAGGQFVGLFANLASAQTLTYSRFCFDLPSNATTIAPLAQGRNAGGSNMWEVDYDAGSKGLDLYFWNGAGARTNLTSPANLIAANTWYCAEVNVNETSTGSAQVWLNGTSMASVNNVDLSTANPYSQLYLWNQVASSTVDFDDVIVSNSYNGPVGAGATPLPAPAVSLSPTSLTFADQQTGTTSASQSVTLTNSGNAPLTITSIGLTGTNSGDFAQTNTCPLSPGTLAAGANCTISVTFTPTATGSRSASLSISDNATGSPHTVSLGGTGTAPAVTLNPTSLTFASQSTGTTSPAQSVTLTNSGTAPLTIGSVSITGTNSGDFAQTNTCPLSPSTLAANGTCTINVTFTPTATGTRTASVSIADNAGGSPQTVSLSGTGNAPPAPVVSLSPTSLTFTSQAVNTTSAAQSVTLTNTGSAALSISSIGFTGTNAGDFAQTNTCPISPSTLAAGANCTISVTFAPLGSGSRAANLSISDNANGSPQTVALSGTGTVAAGTYLSDGFENGLGQWSIINGGGSASTESTTVNSGSFAAALTNASGQYIGLSEGLAGGGQALTYTRFCFYLPNNTVSIAPLAQGRNANGTNVWEIDYDAGSKGLDIYLWNGANTRTDLYTSANLISANRWYCAELQDSETSTGSAQVWLNGTSVASVSNVNLSTSTPYSQIYLWNQTPSSTIYLDDVIVSNAYNGPTGSGTAPLAVTRSSTMATGSSSDLRTLSPGSPVATSATTFSPASHNFASQAVNSTSAAREITVTNSGTLPMSLTSIGITGAHPHDFTQTNTCPATLAIGARCAISVVFKPSAKGNRTVNLVINDNPVARPHTIDLTGTGA